MKSRRLIFIGAPWLNALTTRGRPQRLLRADRKWLTFPNGRVCDRRNLAQMAIGGAPFIRRILEARRAELTVLQKRVV